MPQLPNGGWTGYPPLTTRLLVRAATSTSGSWGCTCWARRRLLGAINFIVTILNMRAPGMKLTEVPMFVWTMMVTSSMVLFATPSLTVAITMLLADRHFGTHFFMPAQGGDPLLWQNLFWFYSHPAVYIMVLPGMGAVSEILPVFSQQAAVRLQLRGLVVRGHRHPGLLGLGAPHVPGGLQPGVSTCLCHGQHDHCRADRHKDLQLDCHAYGAAALNSRRHCCL